MDSNEEENQNFNNYDLIQYNKKNYKMSLLFIQTKELKRLYNSKMDNSFKKYFLVDKSWLDSYKKQNNYESADMFDSFNDWKDYNDFKECMGDSFLVEDEYFTRLFTSATCKTLTYNKINYPINIELVCVQYFIDCLKGSVLCQGCELLIGDKYIAIIDPESRKKNKAVIFICSFVGKEEEYNFLIKVDYILIYNNVNIMKEELKELCIYEGINNYLTKRKIDINKDDE